MQLFSADATKFLKNIFLTVKNLKNRAQKQLIIDFSGLAA